MIKPNVQSILKFFEKLEIENKTDDCLLLCIHCDYSGHVKGSMTQNEIFSFDTLEELVKLLKPYEKGKKMEFQNK